MPNITVELLTGRTLDQKREFVAAVTDNAVRILNAQRASVRIRFDEIETWDVANGGELESDRRGVTAASATSPAPQSAHHSDEGAPA